MMIIIVGLNFCPVGIYAETEFWFAGIKIVMIVGMLILSLVIMLSGGPDHDRLVFCYWKILGQPIPML
jgi:amino acid transporter